MSATAKFYTGLAIVLALIVSAAYMTGYRAGWTARSHRIVPVHHTATPSPRPSLSPAPRPTG